MIWLLCRMMLHATQSKRVRMIATFNRMLSDRSGNFGIITALVMVPLVGAAGLALDLSEALSVRTELYNAADAAAVGAITPNSKAVVQALNMSGDGVIEVGAEEGKKLFFGQMAGGAADLPVTVDAKVTKTGGVIESKVTFSTTVPTTLMRVLGKESVTVSGTSTARYQTPSFMDFYMLLDNTPSMGVAATPADVARMEFETRNGNASGGDKNCAFACHVVSQSGVEDKGSYYFLAKSKGVTIRIDVVAQATAALMATAEKTQTVRGQFRMAAYTFGKKAEDASLYEVAKLTENFSTVAGATDKITLMSIPYQNYNDDQLTSFDKALTGIGEKITSVGTGNSAADRQKIVFFVADGVGDSNKPNGCTRGKVNSTRCIEPIDTKYCKRLKDRNIRIAVLYTTYLELPKNDFWNKWVKPFTNSIGAKMEECASPGFYFEVSPTDGISDAMNALFQKLVSTPRITS